MVKARVVCIVAVVEWSGEYGDYGINGMDMLLVARWSRSSPVKLGLGTCTRSAGGFLLRLPVDLNCPIAYSRSQPAANTTYLPLHSNQSPSKYRKHV